MKGKLIAIAIGISLIKVAPAISTSMKRFIPTLWDPWQTLAITLSQISRIITGSPIRPVPTLMVPTLMTVSYFMVPTLVLNSLLVLASLFSKLLAVLTSVSIPTGYILPLVPRVTYVIFMNTIIIETSTTINVMT